MSLIVTVYTHEGIVMAADSRLTLNAKVSQDGKPREISFDFSNATQKIFCTTGNVGVSTCGAADIQHKPIAGYIEAFAAENGNANVDDLAQQLLTHFRALKADLNTVFHVSGYTKDRQQRIYVVAVAQNKVMQVNLEGAQGAKWDGETDVLTRIINASWVSDDQGKPSQQLPLYPIPWEFFSLQDAVDFAVFAMSMTIGAIRFQNRIKTVGGPIDILVVKPQEAFWVQRKKLHGGQHIEGQIYT